MAKGIEVEARNRYRYRPKYRVTIGFVDCMKLDRLIAKMDVKLVESP
jgi:hypothetical protein